MKELDETSYCFMCGEEFLIFHEHSHQEIYTRQYIGGQGHLVKLGFHKACLIKGLKIDLLLLGWTPPEK